MLITFRTSTSRSTLVQWHKTYTEHRNELNRKEKEKKKQSLSVLQMKKICNWIKYSLKTYTNALKCYVTDALETAIALYYFTFFQKDQMAYLVFSVSWIYQEEHFQLTGINWCSDSWRTQIHHLNWAPVVIAGSSFSQRCHVVGCPREAVQFYN